MPTIGKIKLKDGTILLPTTRIEAVIMDDGSTTLYTKLGNLDSADSTNASNISSHTGNTSNPHSVTATQVGLGNVTNESKATMFTSPALTGTPTAPTVAVNTNTTQIATTEFVNSEIANDATRKSTSTGTLVNYIWSGTQAQYDAIGTKDGNTLYFIV